MKSQMSAFVILVLIAIAGAGLVYAGKVGYFQKQQFAIRPGASFKVVSYQLYDRNGNQISKVYPGQDVYAKVCVKALNWNNGNSVYVEGGIIPNKWYNAGTYAIIGTFKNIPQFATVMSSKCCPSNEFYGGAKLTFGTFDSVGTVRCVTFDFTAPSESSQDHCNNLGSAWQDYGSNYHFGTTLFNGYCYPSSQERVYDVEWYKSITMVHKPTPPSHGGGGSQGGQGGGTGGTPGGGVQAPASAYIYGVTIPKAFGKPGEPIEVDVKLKNTNDYPYTYCVEGGIAPRTWQTFSIVSFSTTEPQDIKLDKCCPQNEFYSSECKTLQPEQTYTFKVYPRVPSQSSYDHCHGHGSAWAGYGDNYVIGVSVTNDKCYPDQSEVQFYTNWNTKFTVMQPAVIVNQTNVTQGNQTYTPGEVVGQPISYTPTGTYVIYGVIALAVGLFAYALYKRKR